MLQAICSRRQEDECHLCEGKIFSFSHNIIWTLLHKNAGRECTTAENRIRRVVSFIETGSPNSYSEHRNTSSGPKRQKPPEAGLVTHLSVTGSSSCCLGMQYKYFRCT